MSIEHKGQRIRHLTTDQGIPGSNPGRVDFSPCFTDETPSFFCKTYPVTGDDLQAVVLEALSGMLLGCLV